MATKSFIKDHDPMTTEPNVPPRTIQDHRPRTPLRGVSTDGQGESECHDGGAGR